MTLIRPPTFIRASIGVLATCVWVAGVGSVSADLVGYWPFDGDTVAAVGMDGVAVNGPIAPAFDRNFGVNGALTFDGALEQYVDIPGGGGLDGATVGTISMWVQWLGAGQDAACCGGAFGPVLSRQNNGVFADNVIALNNADPNAAQLIWRQDSAGRGPTVSGAHVVGSQFWRHVAIRFSQFGSELYLDGVRQGTGFGNALHSAPTLPLSIGAWPGEGSGYATASIDDVAIFDDFLSASQIQALALQTTSPLTVGPGGPGPMPLLTGDTNADGLVNIDDLNNVRNNFGAAGNPDGTLTGDAFRFDGLVNIDDLNFVRNNFGRGIQPIPEPSALILFLTSTMGAAAMQRRVTNTVWREKTPSGRLLLFSALAERHAIPAWQVIYTHLFTESWRRN